jgi:hypothetical protein
MTARNGHSFRAFVCRLLGWLFGFHFVRHRFERLLNDLRSSRLLVTPII